ncbi:hypothetical protein WDU94_012310, partial [Cyamophila willieti]
FTLHLCDCKLTGDKTIGAALPSVPSKEATAESYETLMAMLSSENPSPAINWLAFYAMHTLRFGVKEANSVYTALLGVSDKFGRVFKQSAPCSSFIPCQLAVTKMQSELEKGKDGCIKILPILIDHLSDPAADSIVKSSCLLSLAGVGLGALVWYIKLVAILDAESLVDYFMQVSDLTVKDSFVKVVEFLTNVQENGGLSWRWCRCLEDSALADFSTKKHLLFTSVCLYAVIGKEQERDRMLDLKQFNDRDNMQWNLIKKVCEQYFKRRTAKGVQAAVEGSLLHMTLAAIDNQ